VKPRVIKACTAVAFIDGQTHWKAASCLRTICAALDAPLPPQLLGDAGAAALGEAGERGDEGAVRQPGLPQIS
jgi:hypothetical protein